MQQQFNCIMQIAKFLPVFRKIPRTSHIAIQKAYIRNKGVLFPLSHYSATTQGIPPVLQPLKPCLKAQLTQPSPLSYCWFSTEPSMRYISYVTVCMSISSRRFGFLRSAKVFFHVPRIQEHTQWSYMLLNASCVNGEPIWSTTKLPWQSSSQHLLQRGIGVVFDSSCFCWPRVNKDLVHSNKVHN